MPLMNHFNNQFVHFHFTFIIHFFTLLSLHHFPLSHWHSLCLDFIPKLPSHEHSKKKNNEHTYTCGPPEFQDGWKTNHMWLNYDEEIPYHSLEFMNTTGVCIILFKRASFSDFSLVQTTSATPALLFIWSLPYCTLPNFFNWSFRQMIYS